MAYAYIGRVSVWAYSGCMLYTGGVGHMPGPVPVSAACRSATAATVRLLSVTNPQAPITSSAVSSHRPPPPHTRLWEPFYRRQWRLVAFYWEICGDISKTMTICKHIKSKDARYSNSVRSLKIDNRTENSNSNTPNEFILFSFLVLYFNIHSWINNESDRVVC